jgi:hypothetical protein
MGALTVGFMGSSSVTITDVAFTGTPGDTATLDLKNTGTKTVTLTSARINGARQDLTTPLTLEAGATDTLALDLAWVAGDPYKFDLYDGSGQVIGSYQANAPA